MVLHITHCTADPMTLQLSRPPDPEHTVLNMLDPQHTHKPQNTASAAEPDTGHQTTTLVSYAMCGFLTHCKKRHFVPNRSI